MYSARSPVTRSNSSELEALRSGNRAALARAITRIENQRANADDLWRAARAHCGRAQVVGITGAPGAGKSTLIAALIEEYLARGRRVGVLAFDPSSPLTGGAILGDRVRMGELASEAVFIRSVSARGHLGGLSRSAGQIIDLFDAAGFDPIIVETVGTGQSEVEIADLADARVVVCPPGLGDEVQAIKAGVLEIADLLVVSKADLPTAQRTLLDLRVHFAGRQQGAWVVQVLPVVATRGEGIVELVEALEAHAAAVGRGRRERLRPLAETIPQAPGKTLVLVGATRLARAWARIAVAAGFEVELVDPRLRSVAQPQIAGVSVSCDDPAASIARHAATKNLAVAVCTRDPELSAAALRAALGAQARAFAVPAGHLQAATQAACRVGEKAAPSVCALPRYVAGVSLAELALLGLATVIETSAANARRK